MIDESMMYFENVFEFRSFIHEIDIYNGWRIRSGLLNNRGKSIERRPYVKYFRDLFEDKKLFYRKVSLAEIVSWLDSFSLLVRVFEKLEQVAGREVLNHISIYAEYMIRMSKRMRVDYVLQYRGKLLLLEFRTVNNFEKLRATWQNKFVELMVYKELISNYLNVDVKLYAFIALYEYNNSDPVIKHRKYNNDQVEFLSKYICDFLLTNCKKR
jgi:hypothetical protein